MRKILFCCQVLDTTDPAMSFFHEWIKYFHPLFDKITVIALKVGVVQLPANVQYFSLGKENHYGSPFRRFFYIFKLIKYIWKTRDDYDDVFVHMNQEYILISGIIWKLTGKKVYLWYNHYSGNFLTNISALFCNKIFFTSKSAYTSRFSQSVQMPVGVNTDIFKTSTRDTDRKLIKILFLARIAKSKRLEDLIRALSLQPLVDMKWHIRVTGPTISLDDKLYLLKCKKEIEDLNLTSRFTFTDGVSFSETPSLYSTHDIFINCSKSGMYDKTIFEAAASGCIVISSSSDYKSEAGSDFFFNFGHHSELSDRLVYMINQPNENWDTYKRHMIKIANNHSLKNLSKKIISEIYG